jgi:UDP-N-acetyl-D-glucosamine dehydrogenase
MKSLESKLVDRTARVGVMGLGYVGLPLAVAFAQAGLRVSGFDVDDEKCRALQAGKTYVGDVRARDIREMVRAGRLKVSSHPGILKEMDAVVICVPTPLRKSKDPDISYIVIAANVLAPWVRKGQLVVLESTTYPGTTREVILPKLEERGLRAGKDLFLAFSPERIDPGNAHFGLRNTPKIVAGLTPRCASMAEALFRVVTETVVSVSSLETAEMAKLLENTFRAVNIALVNEVAQMCERLNLNVWEVIDAAATKPFGYMKFSPGPGIGGHCIPLDPHYLSWKLKTLDFHSRFIDLAEDVNSHMPRYVVQRIVSALNARGKALKNSRLLILGVAYKRDISDVRESPALQIIEELSLNGAHVSYADPHVSTLKIGKKVFRAVNVTEAVLARADAAILVTDHSAFDIKRFTVQTRLFIDTRNASRGLHRRNIVRL